jgi:hypothetical protein
MASQDSYGCNDGVQQRQGLCSENATATRQQHSGSNSAMV